VEPRKPEARLQGRVGNDAIAEYSTGSTYARACKVIGEARRCDACPWRRKGPPGEMSGSERSNSATADTRATDRAADKTQTPTAASEPPSADSDVPTEATASAATTAWTGFPYVDRKNCEEHDRRGGNASDQATLAGVAILSVAARVGARRGSSFVFKLEAPCADSRTLKWRMALSPKLNDLCRSVSLSIHCDKRKEKDRLFVGEGRCRGVL
jgi:hypothetical protein